MRPKNLSFWSSGKISSQHEFGVNDRDHYGDHYRDHYGGRVELSGCPDSRTNEKAAGNTQSGSQHYK